MNTRATDVDTLHWLHQEASSLRRNGWTVIEPDVEAYQWRTCPGVPPGSCLTRIRDKALCGFCQRQEAA